MKSFKKAIKSSLLTPLVVVAAALALAFVTPACSDDPGYTDVADTGGGGGAQPSPGPSSPSDNAAALSISLALDGVTFDPAATVLTVGETYDITVQVLRSTGATADAYTGTVAFEAFRGTSSTSSVNLPLNYTFTALDAGVHTFTDAVAFTTEGTFDIHVFDSNFSSIDNTISGIQACPLAGCANPPAAIQIDVSNPLQVLAGSSAAISVTVLDAASSVVANTLVHFELDDTSGGASLSSGEDVTDSNGQAFTTFYAPDTSKTLNITITAGSVSEVLQVNVAPLQAAAIEFVSAVPKSIGVKGSGDQESSTVTFRVVDANGRPVDTTNPVTFTIVGPSGTGCTDQTRCEYLQPASAATTNGLVSTTIHSGRKSGPVRITAQVDVDNPSGTGTITLSASNSEVYIHAGPPSGTHLSIARVNPNLPGFETYGLQTNVTAYVADRYGNPVVEGTTVYFTTEAGIVKANQTATDDLGQSTTVYETAGPAPWDTAWVEPYNPDDYPYGEYWNEPGGCTFDAPAPCVTLPASITDRDQYDTQHGGTPPFPYWGDYNLPNPGDGVATVLAMVQGEEGFNDGSNGQPENGLYDPGEYVYDIGEPYIDANGNGQWDDNEYYSDFNNNGAYDGPNGVWDSDIMLWVPTHILITSTPGGNAWINPTFVEEPECSNKVDSDGDTYADGCWVPNVAIYNSDFVTFGDWNTNSGWTIPDGGCIDFVVAVCDFNHNPVSSLLQETFSVSKEGPVKVMPTEIPNDDDGVGDCLYSFTACDDGDPDTATISVDFGWGAVITSGSVQ